MNLTFNNKPYEVLSSLPDRLTGEIIDGQVYGWPRPAGIHSLICINLRVEIGEQYRRGKQEQDRWQILHRPEIHFQPDRDVLVPDLAGWEPGRLVDIAKRSTFTTPPDWVCEVCLPATRSLDHEVKMRIYAAYGVRYVWLIDAFARTLQAHRLVDDRWHLEASVGKKHDVSVVPFPRARFLLDELWT